MVREQPVPAVLDDIVTTTKKSRHIAWKDPSYNSFANARNSLKTGILLILQVVDYLYLVFFSSVHSGKVRRQIGHDGVATLI